jgi:hypothetical protein
VQGIDRLTLVFNQLVIASLAVSTIITLEAAVKWPESVTCVSALFFLGAVVRSVAMWYVLHAHAHHLDDMEATLAAYRGCGSSPLAEACAVEMPWWDRFAISISLGHLLQFEPAGMEPSPSVSRALQCIPLEHVDDALSPAHHSASAWSTTTVENVSDDTPAMP